MVKISSKIEKAGVISAKNNERVVNENKIDFAKPEKRLTNIQTVIILTLISHDFVKRTADEFAKQLNNFAGALVVAGVPTALAKKYNYSPDDLKEIVNDAAYFSYWNTLHGTGVTYASAWVKKGDEIRSGKGTSVSAWPVGADVSSAPDDVPPGAETRFREQARKAKGQTRIYTEADGITMNIEIINSVFNPSEGQPELSVIISDGGHPLIQYIKSKYTGINIYKDAGDGKGFQFLLTCNDPNFADMSALPAVGVSAAWTYKAFYIFGGKEVGTISKNTVITVIGV